jgi:hypothetical protein
MKKAGISDESRFFHLCGAEVELVVPRLSESAHEGVAKRLVDFEIEFATEDVCAVAHAVLSVVVDSDVFANLLEAHGVEVARDGLHEWDLAFAIFGERPEATFSEGFFYGAEAVASFAVGAIDAVASVDHLRDPVACGVLEQGALLLDDLSGARREVVPDDGEQGLHGGEFVFVERRAAVAFGVAAVAQAAVEVATEVGEQELFADKGVVNVYHNRMGLLIELGMRASEWRLGASFVDAKVMIL